MNTRMSVSRLVLALAALASGSAAGASSIFVNELHYDNGGTDVGEGVEIAAPAGTDLGDWALFLYNGSTGTTYGSQQLQGIVEDLQHGMGTLFFELTLQNGPDAIALVAPDQQLVQFLSYEGVVSAADGPAAGQTSSDIAVSENSDTLAGQSLQLIGTGRYYEDFDWAESMTSTYGQVNTAQQFAAVPLPGALPLLSAALILLGARRHPPRL